MRNRRKQNRRTDGKGGRPVEPDQLRGNMALIVIHHDIGIETLVQIHRIGAERTISVNPGRARLVQRRHHNLRLFRTKKPVLSRMRIDPGNSNPGRGDTDPL